MKQLMPDTFAKFENEKNKMRGVSNEIIELENKLKNDSNEKFQIYKFNDEFFELVKEILQIKPYYIPTSKPRINEKMNKLIKKYDIKIQKSVHYGDDFDWVDAIRSGMPASFYPTPSKCIMAFKDMIENAKIILEPTAGLGHMLNIMRLINPDAEKIAIEFNAPYIQILKMFNPDIKIVPNGISDFFDLTANNIDTILINPPFAKGDDKRFYMDFLFHSLYLLNKYDNKNNFPKIRPEMGIISSFIIDKNKIDKNKNEFTFDDLISITNNQLSTKKLLNILQKYQDELKVSLNENMLKNIRINLYDEDNLNEPEQEALMAIRNTFGFYIGQYIGECDSFIGTSVKPAMYKILAYINQ